MLNQTTGLSWLSNSSTPCKFTMSLGGHSEPLETLTLPRKIAFYLNCGCTSERIKCPKTKCCSYGKAQTQIRISCGSRQCRIKLFTGKDTMTCLCCNKVACINHRHHINKRLRRLGLVVCKDCYPNKYETFLQFWTHPELVKDISTLIMLKLKQL